MRSFFPDINVWIAIAYRGHQHHPAAIAWFEGLGEETCCFCRQTQLGFLRLLTNPSVLREEVRNPAEAWETYDQLLNDEYVFFLPEPAHEELESALRQLTSNRNPNSRQWPDAYLAAFAQVADLTLVTFDRSLSRMIPGNALLLG